eukprot:TRINITY_DN34827_c0_g2_i1.p1 TRINITY_DN34827_c0_g2~~TRINITY_DN34827_c0_g2_i1.p1  ORF type:complete len:183 (-),score=30.63 TRINITY_DN34827_c0_g2_i1:266-814(-)
MLAGSNIDLAGMPRDRKRVMLELMTPEFEAVVASTVELMPDDPVSFLLEQFEAIQRRRRAASGCDAVGAVVPSQTGAASDARVEALRRDVPALCVVPPPQRERRAFDALMASSPRLEVGSGSVSRLSSCSDDDLPGPAATPRVYAGQFQGSYAARRGGGRRHNPSSQACPSGSSCGSESGFI